MLHTSSESALQPGAMRGGKPMSGLGAGSTVEKWQARYQGSTYLHGKEPVAYLRDNLGLLSSRSARRLLSSRSALDLATGEGRNAVFLAQHGFDVTGVDISLRGVRKARALAAERGVSLLGVVADLAAFDLGVERWDLIADFYYLERSLFPRIRGALRRGGRFVLEHFTSEHPKLGSGYGPQSADLLLAPGELLRAFDGFQILDYEESVVALDDGRHRGPAALARIIARKP